MYLVFCDQICNGVEHGLIKKSPSCKGLWWRRGRYSNIISSMEAREPPIKKHPLWSVLLVAERAGFEYHLLNGGARTSNKKTPLAECFACGGEGGIRTREPLWVTRFPSVRAKPDYATSPNRKRPGLYHVFSNGNPYGGPAGMTSSALKKTYGVPGGSTQSPHKWISEPDFGNWLVGRMTIAASFVAKSSA